MTYIKETTHRAAVTQSVEFALQSEASGNDHSGCPSCLKIFEVLVWHQANVGVVQQGWNLKKVSFSIGKFCFKITSRSKVPAFYRRARYLLYPVGGRV